MAFLDNVRDLFGGSRRLGLELGREVTVVEAKGDLSEVSAAGRSSHAGYSGEELGNWLKRWLGTVGTEASKARLVVTDGNIYHYLVDLPEMSDSERHLAAGAEVRKLAPVPANQLAYSHMAVGKVQSGGAAKDRVLVAAVDKGTLRNATAAAEAADLEAELVTTVPSALVRAAQLLPSRSGGVALAWIAPGRSYLVVFHDGRLELVRDFQLRGVEADTDPAAASEAVASELRRSFLYFGQRVQGAQVERLLLAGPMAGLQDLAHRISDELDVHGEPFDLGGHVDLGSHIDPDEQPAFATALGAAALEGQAAANLVSPEEVTESRVRRATSIGAIAAGVLLLLLVGWGLLALLDATAREGRLEEIQTRLTTARNELQQAQAMQQERAAHQARRALLEVRAQESTLIAATLQGISQRIPNDVALQRIQWSRSTGPAGQPYWNAQLDGLVFGDSRSESQSIFNRFWTLLANDVLVHDIHLVEPLVIGTQEARVVPERTAAIRESLSGPRVIRGQRQAQAGRRADRSRPAGSQFFEGPASAGGVDYLDDTDAQAGETIVTTTLDGLPPFGPTETTVGFKILLQLKGIDTGGAQ